MFAKMGRRGVTNGRPPPKVAPGLRRGLSTQVANKMALIERAMAIASGMMSMPVTSRPFGQPLREHASTAPEVESALYYAGRYR